jgi:hypothetical protein
MIQFDSIPKLASAPAIVVTGSADSSVVLLHYGNSLSSLAATRLTNGRFRIVLELVPGQNEFFFVGETGAGARLAPERMAVTYRKSVTAAHHIPNSLDLHGEAMGYERLSGERNPNYKTRLLQGAKATPDRQGPPVMAATEIALPFSRRCLRVRVARSAYNRPMLTNPWVRVTLDKFEWTGDEMVAQEGPIVFDRGYPYVTPGDVVAPFGKLEVLTPSGERLPTTDFEYDSELNRVWMKNRAYHGVDLLLRYQIVDAIDLNADIATLVTDIDGTAQLEAFFTESAFHDDADLSAWVLPMSWARLDTQEDWPVGVALDQPGVYLNVSEVKTFPLHELRVLLLNAEGSGLGTDLERYVQELRQVDRRTWNVLIVGRDGLRDENFVPLYDAFPHLSDQIRGLWGPYNLHEEAYIKSGQPFKGVNPDEWQSGTGTLGDLEPSVVTQELQDFADVVEESKVPSNILYGIL